MKKLSLLFILILPSILSGLKPALKPLGTFEEKKGIKRELPQSCSPSDSSEEASPEPEKKRARTIRVTFDQAAQEAATRQEARQEAIVPFVYQTNVVYPGENRSTYRYKYVLLAHTPKYTIYEFITTVTGKEDQTITSYNFYPGPQRSATAICTISQRYDDSFTEGTPCPGITQEIKTAESIQRLGLESEVLDALRKANERSFSLAHKKNARKVTEEEKDAEMARIVGDFIAVRDKSAHKEELRTIRLNHLLFNAFLYDALTSSYTTDEELR